MADPRVNLVKPCPPAYLGKSSSEIGKSTSDRRTFFNAAGKIGDLQVLNAVGAGKVGQGLRTLASVSNSIRTGCGSLPTSIGGVLGSVFDAASSTATAGTDWVLNQMGMNIKTADAVRAFQPGIANQALGQAQQIYQQVRQGNFNYTQIPGYLQDFQNLERLGRNIFTPGAFDKKNKLAPQCEASPYALDLIARAPKHKFMFVVQLVPSPAYHTLMNLDAAFMVHESSRPNVKYQMEDVNFYNFRSKIITKTEFEPMTIKFYDDIRNQVGMYHAALVKALSPIANYPKPDEFWDPESQGMAFEGIGAAPAISGVQGGFTGRRYAASSNNLLENSKAMFTEIILYHLFDAGRKMNVYRFFSPRIMDLKLDDLSMKESSITTMDMQFAYDAVYIDTDVSFNGSDLAKRAQQASAGVGNSALYGLKYINSASAATGPNNAGIQPGLPVPTQGCGPDGGKGVNTGSPGLPTGNASGPAPAQTPSALGAVV